jgi:hypothetical protein
MSVTLKLKHQDGTRFRQQMARKVERTENGTVLKGTEWAFEREDCQQDEDARKVDSDGKKLKLGTYTIYVTAGLKNLVIEKKGKVEHVDFRNSSLRNQLRVQYQKLVDANEKKGDKKPHFEWRNDGSPQYVPANTFTGVFVGDNQRAIIDEMPT